MNKITKILFMGTPSYATAILKELVLQKNIKIVALYTQPDKKVGRKKILTPPDTKEYILKNELNIPIFQPTSLKDKEVIQTIKKLNPDKIIVAAYGKILPKEILDIATCINLHASILPKYRGASPIQDSLLNHDDFSGVTAMLMKEGLDDGDILGYSFIKIDQNILVEELFEALSKIAAKLTIKTISKHNIKPIIQNSSLSSKCSKISKQDGLIYLNDAMVVYNKFRAYHGWPGIFLESGLKFLDIKLLDKTTPNTPNKILNITDDFIEVGCKIGSIALFKVQAVSKKPVSSLDYIRGKRLKIGDKIY